MHHGVEGENPTQGQKAFASMKQKEVRKQSTTTRRALGQGNQAVAKSDQIPGGRDQQSNWTRMPQGRNQGGREAKASGERGPTHNTTRKAQQEAHPQQRGHKTAQRNQQHKSQTHTPANRNKHQKAQGGAKRPKEKPKRGQGKHSPQKGNQKGGGTTKGQAKDPHSSKARGGRTVAVPRGWDTRHQAR